MRYRLRTLMIVAAIGPPLLAGAVWLAVELIRHFFDYPIQRPILEQRIPVVGALVP